MKDLIIGIVIGVLATVVGFSYLSISNQIGKIEAKQEAICKDINKIVSKIGPLPEDKKGR